MSKKHFLVFLISFLFLLPLKAESAGIPLPAIIGGTVRVDGIQLTQATATGYTFTVTRQDGTAYNPAAEDTNGLNGLDWYGIKIPIYDAAEQPGGANPSETAVIHVYKNGSEVMVTFPANGEFPVGDSSSRNEINLVAQIPCTNSATPSGPSPTGTDVDVNVDLDWADADGATSYDVYFGTSSTPPFATNVAGSSYDPGTLAANTPYYWKIVAKNACGDTEGSEWSFTTCSLPATPANPSPGDSATGVLLNADLDWDNAAGATSYDVYFGTTSSPPLVTNVAVSTYNPGTLAANTPYYWKIVAKNACGDKEGPEWSFTTCNLPATPSNTSPANAATGVPLNANLDWDDDAGATSYDVYFGTASSPPLVANVTVSSYTGALTAETLYYWKIVAKNSCGNATGQIWSFTTGTSCDGNGAPPIPARIGGTVTINETQLIQDTDTGYTFKVTRQDGSAYTPVAEDTDGLNTSDLYIIDVPIYDANAQPCGAAPGDTVVIHLYNNGSEVSLSLPDNGIFTVGTSGSTKTVNLTVCTNIYYRDVDGDSYGDPNDFTTACSTPANYVSNNTDCDDTNPNIHTVPDAPSNPSPTDTATDVPLNTVLDWDDADQATSYDVYFGTVFPPPLVTNVTDSTYNPGALVSNTPYYWKIVAKNSCGDTDGTIWSFTTCSLPATLASPSPGDTATEVSLDADLYWADASEDTSYDVYLDGVKVCEDIAGSSCDPGALTCNTTYSWQVVASNLCGNTQGPVWSFTTRAPATYQVGGANPDYNTIEDALAVAEGCDTIQVAAGTYFPSGNLIVPEDVKLIGGGWYDCTIELGHTGQIQLGSYSTLTGFTISNDGGTRYESMVLAWGVSSVTITNNVIQGNPDYDLLSGPAGIFLYQSSGLVENNTIDEGCVGIRTDTADGATIINNIVVNNKSGWADANESDELIVDYNNFWHNTSNPSGGNNISEDPLFVDADNGNYHLQRIRNCADILNPPPASVFPCIDTGDPSALYNDIGGTRNDMGADGGPGGTAPDTTVPGITEASADPTNGNAPLDVEFTGDADDEWGIACWSWDFDDKDGIQQDSSEQNPSHTYNDCGGYTARLTVTDHSGNSRSATTATINVSSDTVAIPSANPLAVIAGGSIAFSGDASGTATSFSWWSWDFDDGDGIQQDSSSQDDSHIYTAPGAYTATLTVTDEFGCVASATVPVTIIDGASYSPEILVATPVDSTGDTIEANGIAVEIPAGALSEEKVITISKLNGTLPDFPPGISGIKLAVDFGPDGCEFGNPGVTITIPYTQDDLDAAGVTDPHDLKVYYYKTSTDTWVELQDTTVYTTPPKRITATTYHFTVYTMGAGVPTAPTGLSATAASDSQINLNWTDTSSDEDGFTIERSDDGRLSYTQIDTVDTPNATSYANTGLSASTNYCYRVRAYNANGSSDPSNDPCATTQDPPSNGDSGSQTTSGGGGGCFIATAAFGTPMVKQVRILSRFRDKYLLTNSLGNRFVEMYYEYSPPIAEYIAQSEFLRKVVRIALWPLIAFSLFMLELGWLGKLVAITFLLASSYFLVRSVRKLTMYRQLSE